jgi:hypothetical protein
MMNSVCFRPIDTDFCYNLPVTFAVAVAIRFLFCSAQKESSPVAAQLTAGLAAAAASNMLMPLAAAAEVTPSLR